MPTVEVRDAAGNELVTTLEILSPVNKREPGLGRYRERREKLYQAGVHLLEIDLLRRGTRPLAGHPRLPATPYLITLTRARAPAIGLWPFGKEGPIPTLPVPLRDPDPDVPLDLGSALRTVYDEAAYDLSVDYSLPPPPPPLSQGEAAFVAERVRSPGR